MVVIGIMIFLAAFAALTIAAYRNDKHDDECVKDIPCQECGRCYDNHLGGAFGNHSYVYPRGLHR